MKSRRPQEGGTTGQIQTEDFSPFNGRVLDVERLNTETLFFDSFCLVTLSTFQNEERVHLYVVHLSERQPLGPVVGPDTHRSPFESYYSEQVEFLSCT